MTEPTAEAIRSRFRERGWSIQMDDRPGQAFDPFTVLAQDEVEAAGLDVDVLRRWATSLLNAADRPDGLVWVTKDEVRAILAGEKGAPR